MTHFLFYCSAKCNEKIFFCRNDVEARASVRTPSYAPVYVFYKIVNEGSNSIVICKTPVSSQTEVATVRTMELWEFPSYFQRGASVSATHSTGFLLTVKLCVFFTKFPLRAIYHSVTTRIIRSSLISGEELTLTKLSSRAIQEQTEWNYHFQYYSVIP